MEAAAVALSATKIGQQAATAVTEIAIESEDNH